MSEPGVLATGYFRRRRTQEIIKMSIKKITQYLFAAAVLMFGINAGFGQKQQTTSKAQLINEIVPQVMPAIPMSIHKKHLDGFLAEMPKMVRKELRKGVEKEIEQTAAFSKAQKANLKERIPELFVKSEPMFKRIIDQKFGTPENFVANLVREDLAQWSVSDVIELHRFISSKAGKSYLKVLATIANNFNNPNPTPLELEEKYKPEMNSFIQSPTGKNFNELITLSPDEMMDKLGKIAKQALEEINSDPELDKIYKDFKAGA